MILLGDNREQLATLPAGCVHCCVTSPPYYALRSYLPNDHPDKHLELGSEKTPDEYLANQVNVFRAVRRVLRNDGLLFVNLGDSYSANKHGSKDGDLLNMPHRFALAMIADGWFHRDTIIWHKKSPMPSSQNGVRWEKCKVKVAKGNTPPNDREFMHGCQGAKHSKSAYENILAEWADCPGCPKCIPNGGLILRRGRFRTTTAHEYIFMFAKSKLYYANAEQVREKATCRGPGNKDMGKYEDYDRNDSTQRRQLGKASGALSDAVETRIPRSVMTFPNEPYSRAHFATYPSSLPRFAIEMATSAHGCCPACGAQYAPIVEKERVPTRPGVNNVIDESGMSNRDPERHIQRVNVLGHRATCQCNAGEPIPCTVLDPYGGSGTTAQAANALGRKWILCELNEAYVDQERIDKVPKWANPKPVRPKIVLPANVPMPLFDFARMP